MPRELSDANLIHYLCQEWGYPGISAVLREDASVLLPIVNVYEWGQEKDAKPQVVAQTTVTEGQAIQWDPPEEISQAEFMAMEAQPS